MKKELISIEHVSFSYGEEHVLEDITFTIEKGDFIGIIGPNGSGKTTLLKIMLGLLKPSSGEVRLFGTPVSSFRQWPRIGYVPQRVTQVEQQFPVSVGEIVAQGRTAKRGIFKQLRSHDYTAINNALAAVGMKEYKNRLIHELSGGQKQRVYIARAIAGEPDLLVFDEPTVGVDVESQEEFYTLLAKLRKKNNLTLAMVSHDVDVVVHEVNKLACINKRLTFHGTPNEFVKENHLEQLYGKERIVISHAH